jgi:ABC-type oligopeptide transport system ATPase subunit
VALIEVENLTKVYPVSAGFLGSGGSGGVRAVDGVTLRIEEGETLGLAGESGSGKSTLGRMILRLIDPTAGTIRFDGREITHLHGGELRRLRRQMQIVFQDPFASLDPRQRAGEIVAEPWAIHEPGLSSGERRRRANELLTAVGLDSSAAARFPHEFSGGQRQRIGIARALALRPRFLVADEPVSALDVSVGAQIVNLLASLRRDFGLTCLFISHSMPVVRHLSTRIAVMRQGKLVEIGSTSQITEHPQQEYTRALLEATPEITSGQ